MTTRSTLTALARHALADLPPAPAGPDAPARRAWWQGLARRAMALAAARVAMPARAGVARADAREGDPFTLGVASGEPGPDSVLLWTRLAPRPHEPGGGLPPRPLTLRWQVAEDEGFRRGLREGDAVADPALAHSVRARVDGLAPDRRWWYRFIAGDATSPVGRTRTTPAPDADVRHWRLGLASCQHYEHGEYAAHREMAATDLDLVLFVGDYIYEGSHPRLRVRRHEGPEPVDLHGYRARHATYRLDPWLQANHAAHPWVLGWDDHEVRNDYAGPHGDDTLSPEAFLALRTAAWQAWFEHLPLDPARRLADGSLRMHGSLRWGRLARLWSLDGRQFRDPQACNAPGVAGGRLRWDCAAMDDPARTVFGTAQESWLAQGLREEARPWKLVAQGSQLSPWSLHLPGGLRGRYSDGWDGYPAARRRLMQAMAQASPGAGVVSLGGDVHRHVAARLRLRPEDERSPVVASEFVTSSVTSRGLPRTLLDLAQRQHPDLLHLRGDERGWTELQLTPLGLTADFRATAFPARAEAPLHSQARWHVAAGRPGPERA
jgi:alkaline phosphatase D